MKVLSSVLACYLISKFHQHRYFRVRHVKLIVFMIFCSYVCWSVYIFDELVLPSVFFSDPDGRVHYKMKNESMCYYRTFFGLYQVPVCLLGLISQSINVYFLAKVEQEKQKLDLQSNKSSDNTIEFAREKMDKMRGRLPLLLTGAAFWILVPFTIVAIYDLVNLDLISCSGNKLIFSILGVVATIVGGLHSKAAHRL